MLYVLPAIVTVSLVLSPIVKIVKSSISGIGNPPVVVGISIGGTDSGGKPVSISGIGKPPVVVGISIVGRGVLTLRLASASLCALSLSIASASGPITVPSPVCLTS